MSEQTFFFRDTDEVPIYFSQTQKKVILALLYFCLLSCLFNSVASAEGFCVSSEPDGVRYYIDGMYIGETKPNNACTTDYASAFQSHTITFEKEGYESYSLVQKKEEMGYGVYPIHHIMRPLSKPVDLKSTPQIKRTKGDIDFYCPTNNADIFLNGVKVRNTNTDDRFESNDLQPGIYLIEAKKQGYNDWSMSVEVFAGQTTTATIDLMIKKSKITITSIPSDLEVFIDGVFIGNTPIKTEVFPGFHNIKIQPTQAFENYEKSVDIALETKELNFRLTPSAEIAIPEAEKMIELNRQYNPANAENEIMKARNFLINQDYIHSLEAAKNASKWANDVDGDGVANSWDFIPYFVNELIYKISLSILCIIGILIIIDRYRCKVTPKLQITVREDPTEKRKFNLLVSIFLDKQIKSMTCTIYLDNKIIEIVDASGKYNFNLGQLKQGTHEIKIKLSIFQRRYGEVELNKTLEIDTDKQWFGNED